VFVTNYLAHLIKQALGLGKIGDRVHGVKTMYKNTGSTPESKLSNGVDALCKPSRNLQLQFIGSDKLGVQNIRRSTSRYIFRRMALKVYLTFFISLVTAISVTGCGAISKAIYEKMGDSENRMSPPKIHVLDNTNHSLKDQQKNISDAEKIPALYYYDALNKAKEGGINNKENILKYVGSGTFFVKAECLRWFQRLSDSQREVDYANQTTNIITALGTTLLGLGGASNGFITGYGALNTTRAGLEKNYTDSFLLAPNARKVKPHIFNLLDEEEEKLSNMVKSDKITTFLIAYEKLERYADICTYSTAKEITDNALGETKSMIDDDNQNIKIISTRSNAAEIALLVKQVSENQAEVLKVNKINEGLSLKVKEIEALQKEKTSWQEEKDSLQKQIENLTVQKK
jgi:hypothetical protein